MSPAARYRADEATAASAAVGSATATRVDESESSGWATGAGGASVGIVEIHRTIDGFGRAEDAAEDADEDADEDEGAIAVTATMASTAAAMTRPLAPPPPPPPPPPPAATSLASLTRMGVNCGVNCGDATLAHSGSGACDLAELDDVMMHVQDRMVGAVASPAERNDEDDADDTDDTDDDEGEGEGDCDGVPMFGLQDVADTSLRAAARLVELGAPRDALESLEDAVTLQRQFLRAATRRGGGPASRASIAAKLALADTLRRIAQVHDDMGAAELALGAFERALKLQQRVFMLLVEPPDENSGGVSAATGAAANAVAVSEVAAAAAQTLFEMAAVHEQNEDDDAALACHLRALEAREAAFTGPEERIEERIEEVPSMGRQATMIRERRLNCVQIAPYSEMTSRRRRAQVKPGIQITFRGAVPVWI